MDITPEQYGPLAFLHVAATDEQREQCRASELWQRGDCRLGWVNEGDLCELITARPTPSEGEVTASPFVPELSQASLDHMEGLRAEIEPSIPQPTLPVPQGEVERLIVRMVEIADRDDTTGLATDALREAADFLANNALTTSPDTKGAGTIMLKIAEASREQEMWERRFKVLYHAHPSWRSADNDGPWGLRDFLRYAGEVCGFPNPILGQDTVSKEGDN